MSGSVKYPAVWAQKLASSVQRELGDLCVIVHIAGSLRRGASQVGDIEIVAQPKEHRAGDLLARMDTWVATGRVRKAVYGDGTHRWGEKYRGFCLNGLDIKIEVFVVDADNLGYQLWLRTGPGDANQYIMSQMLERHAPYRCEGGYFQHNGARLRVSTEAELFRLLGMPIIPPNERSVERYHREMGSPAWGWAAGWTVAQQQPEQRIQGSLF